MFIFYGAFNASDEKTSSFMTKKVNIFWWAYFDLKFLKVCLVYISGEVDRFFLFPFFLLEFPQEDLDNWHSLLL